MLGTSPKVQVPPSVGSTTHPTESQPVSESVSVFEDVHAMHTNKTWDRTPKSLQSIVVMLRVINGTICIVMPKRLEGVDTLNHLAWCGTHLMHNCRVWMLICKFAVGE